ncbi:DUF4256 domain-containing protein [Sphingobacterium cellulitidis]|uniref:DUF4256 domain-containing protein n=1 Tax=Sphingobacterium cellulitidis TaxID=1768011 RepID=UPI000B940840|nr:hypothetical protein CHT99_06865 [Sphingobacterium cellulitidis]
MKPKNHTLDPQRMEELYAILQKRFEKNMHRHPNLNWSDVKSKLDASPEKFWSINEMEITEGEPDVVSIYDNDEIIFIDCSPESPKGRRSLCYDEEALESRKEHKPKDSAINLAKQMGVKILNEQEYAALQSLGQFDAKTTSWLETPSEVREKGGAIFGDFRFGRVFTYHNGAESYYAARAFRAILTL